jgi:hypothetical protein
VAVAYARITSNDVIRLIANCSGSPISFPTGCDADKHNIPRIVYTSNRAAAGIHAISVAPEDIDARVVAQPFDRGFGRRILEKIEDVCDAASTQGAVAPTTTRRLRAAVRRRGLTGYRRLFISVYKYVTIARE